MKKYLTALLIILSALVLVVTGCAKSQQENHNKSAAKTDTETLIVQAPLAPPSIPLVSMIGKQNVQVIWYKKTEEAMSRIIDDSVDVSIIPVNSMAVLYNKGVNIQLGAVSTWGILYLVSGDPQINDWKDLQGKTVAVGAMGYSPDLVFRGLLANKGLANDVKIIYGTSPEIAQMLIAKKMNLAVLPEPLLTSVLSKNKDTRIIMNLEQEWMHAFTEARGLPQAGLAVSKRLITENPSAWRGFYDEYNESLLAYVNNPGIIGSDEEKLLNLPAAVIKKSLGRSNLKLQSSQEAKNSVNRYLEQILLIDPDAVGGKVPGQESDFYLKK